MSWLVPGHKKKPLDFNLTRGYCGGGNTGEETKPQIEKASQSAVISSIIEKLYKIYILPRTKMYVQKRNHFVTTDDE